MEEKAKLFPNYEEGKYTFYAVGLELWSPNEQNDGGFKLRYEANIGFGEVVFLKEKGKVYVDDEYMSEQFVTELFQYFQSTLIPTR